MGCGAAEFLCAGGSLILSGSEASLLANIEPPILSRLVYAKI